MVFEARKKLGNILIKRGYITSDRLEEILKEQQEVGGRLGELLIGEGDVSAFQLAKAFAEHKGKEFVNLEETPCDEFLVKDKDREDYLNLHAIPWKQEEGIVYIATTDIYPELEEWASKKYHNYDFIITSPFDILWASQKNIGEFLSRDARDTLWRHDRKASARKLFLNNTTRNWVVFIIFALFIAVFIGNNFLFALAALHGFYAITLLSKIIFIMVGLKEDSKILADSTDLSIDDSKLPVYTILVPMFKEKKTTIENLINSIKAIYYPISKLDVKLVVEEGDKETINHIKSIRPESYFQIIEVPYSLPQTKPKACNYALRFALGDYITIYDAEDKPDPLQLRKVLNKFENSHPNVACVQARLNYYNRNETWLTKLFSLEYASWFNYMIPALDRIGIPIPLGGTSNHFKIEIIRKLHAWDPYNVTEDADLGIRLVQNGYKTKIIKSLTLEEAPISVSGWLRQRSRWIKGYIQTYIVHMRQPIKLYKMIKLKGMIGFLFFVGAPSIVFVTIPLSVILFITSLFKIEDIPAWLGILSISNLLVMVLFHMFIANHVITKSKWYDMKSSILLFPFYWVLHVVASLKSVKDVILRPHHWEKTEHGLSKYTKHD